MPENGIQNINIKDRKYGEISGVTEVLSFDEASIVLDTAAGRLTVEGEELNVTALDTEGGKICFCGNMTGLYYADKEPEKRGFFKRMFT